MTIASLPSSSATADLLLRFYEACPPILDQHKQTAFSAAESFFYNRARPASETMEDLARAIHRTAYNHFHFLQFVFSTVNALGTVYSTKQVVNALGSSSPGSLPIALALTLIPATGWVLFKAIQRDKSHHSKVQIFSGAIQLIGVVQSVALAVLTENKISFFIRAAMNGYSLCKNNQFSWLSIRGSREVNRPENPPIINKIDVAYSALLFCKPKQNDICSVCQEDQPQPDQVFCTNGHTFHRDCLKNFLSSHEENLYRANNYVRTQTVNYTNGSYTPPSYSYKVDIDDKHLPGCPECREHPPQNHFGITVHDEKGVFGATVNILKTNSKNHQRTFEKVDAVYSAFQAILGLLQQIPEFTGGITLLRRIMMVSDIVMGVIAHYYLFKNLKEKKKSGFWGIAPAVLAAIPYLALTRLFAPKEDLTQLNLKNVTARWEHPILEEAQNSLAAYRFLTTLGMACFSKTNKIFSATSLLSQAVALLGAMNVHWLRIDQTNIGGRRAEFSTYILLPSIFSKSSEVVKNSITYIADLQKRIIKKGEWFLTHHYSRDGYRYDTLEIRYTMKKIRDLREYLFKPFIWTWSGLDGSASDNYRRLPLSVNLN